MTRRTDMPVADAPPDEPAVTAYDHAHLRLYLRLLDAEQAGACWREVAALVLGLDPNCDPEHAWRVYAAHLARAHWMTTHGYPNLLTAG
jgi:type VI secretion system activator RovC-like protein